MIITSTQDNTVTSNNFDSTSMGVIADGRMFSLLLNNLYSMPERAVIRELSTNALDAHVKAGNLDKPYIIQLPTKFNPTLIIRDYGTGLDEKEINLYLNTLFSSDKNNSNDLVGGFGLGAKSPFAITPSYTIESFKDGFKYSALWYKKEDGTPVLIVTNKEVTDEENGIKFIINVDNKYIDNIRSAIKDELFHFPLKPKIVTNIEDLSTEVDPKEFFPVESFKNDKVTVYQTSNFNFRNQFYVSIGGVCYRLNTATTKAEYFNRLSPQDLSSKAAFVQFDFTTYILNLNVMGYSSNYNKIVVLDMPIGSLTLPMSRESIEDTVENYQKINEIFLEQQSKAIDVYLKPFKDYMDSKPQKEYKLKEFVEIALNNNFNKSSSLPGVLNLPARYFEMFGAVKTGLDNFSSLNLTPTHFVNSFKQGGILYGQLIENFNLNKFRTTSLGSIRESIFNNVFAEQVKFTVITADYTRSKSTYNDPLTNSNFTYKNYPIFVVNKSNSKYSVPNIKHYFDNVYQNKPLKYPNTNDDKNKVLIYVSGSSHIIEVFEKYFEFLFENYFYNYDVVDYSDIPKAPRAVRVANPNSVSKNEIDILGLKNYRYNCLNQEHLTINYYNKCPQIDSRTDSNGNTLPFSYKNYYDNENVLFISENFRYSYDNLNLLNELSRFLSGYDFKIIFATENKLAKYYPEFKKESSKFVFKLEKSLTELQNQIKEELLNKNIVLTGLHYKLYFVDLFTKYSTYFDRSSSKALEIVEHLYLNTEYKIFDKDLDEYIRNNKEFFEELEEVLKVNYYGSVNVTYKNHVYKTNVNNKDEYFIYNLYSDYLIQSYDNHFKSQTDKYDYFSDLLINTECYKVFFKSFTASLDNSRAASKFILHLTNKFLNQFNLTWN